MRNYDTKRQHDKGKLHAMERIEALLDEGSFREVGTGITNIDTQLGLKGGTLPYDGVITGYGTIDGRRVCIYSQDFTVAGGTLGHNHGQKIASIINMAVEYRCPLIGINDSGGLTASQLKANVKKVVDATLEARPDCEFLYLKCFTANPVLYSDSKFKSYWKAVDELAAEYDCFYSLDLYTPGMKMLETKKYLDVTGNGINHPNDFIVRFYAMNLVNLFVEYKA